MRKNSLEEIAHSTMIEIAGSTGINKNKEQKSMS
jgi:hypothetical protein